MLFVSLLILVTTAIAGAAAYFSVYGLAYTFSGVFWSVVAMGTSLEAGKLIAASYLYRYWTRTHVVLKAYLIAGIAALMLLTSVGIFGYLSSGYQQDVLPLKQKHERITLLESEKAMVLSRKQAIDQLMTGGPNVNNVTRSNGNIDPAAARTIRETTKARESLVRQYKDEQKMVTARLQELDAELLTLKQEVIQAEAKIGPITYIASSFNLPTDDATKYLIFVIIFAFDPMAVALTLAVNNALKIRREEADGSALLAAPIPTLAPPPEPEPVAEPEVLPELELVPDTQPEPKAEIQPEPVSDPVIMPEPEVLPEPEPDPEPAAETEVLPEPEPEAASEPAHKPETAPAQTALRARPYPTRWKDTAPDKIGELLRHHKYLTAKRDSGITLSDEERWELANIERILSDHGVNLYL